MLKRLNLIGLAALAAFFMLAGAVLNINLSLWLLWASLPPGDIRLAFDLQQPASPLLIGYLKPYLNPALAPILEKSEKLAFSRISDQLVISALPRPVWSLRAQQAFSRQLWEQGWQVRRQGLAVMATRLMPGAIQPALPSIRETVAESLRRRLSGGLPSRPLIIAAVEEGVSPIITTPFSVLADVDGEDLHLAITQNAQFTTYYPIDELIANDPYATVRMSDLSVALPSVIYSQLPDNLIAEWRDLLGRQFGFVRTVPNILAAALGSQNVVKIQLTLDEATVAVEGNTEEFVRAIQEAVQAEEAYLRPESKAFRLPDDTLGFELVPGPPRSIFGDRSTYACRQDFDLWLCQEGERSALSTKPELARQALHAVPVHIRLAKKYAQRLPLPIDELTAVSTPAGDIMIKAKLRTN